MASQAPVPTTPTTALSIRPKRIRFEEFEELSNSLQTAVLNHLEFRKVGKKGRERNTKIQTVSRLSNPIKYSKITYLRKENKSKRTEKNTTLSMRLL